MNKFNSIGLTETEMNEIYRDSIPVKVKKIENEHIHWECKGFCKICGKRIEIEGEL